MNLRDRFEWLVRMGLLVFVLAALAFLSAVTAIRFAIQGREVEMPDVVGMKSMDAQAALAKRGLGMKIADRIYSDQPVDRVARQSPPAGTRVKLTQRAHVVLSLGRQQVSIPELEGKSLRAARIELLRSGLHVGEVSQCALPGREPDHVVQQDPPPRATDATSPRVNLLVALPAHEPSYLMPDLAGLPLGEAQRRLSAAGLRLAKVSVAPSSGAPRGTVSGQTPLRGARITANAAVELQVAE